MQRARILLSVKAALALWLNSMLQVLVSHGAASRIEWDFVPKFSLRMLGTADQTLQTSVAVLSCGRSSCFQRWRSPFYSLRVSRSSAISARKSVATKLDHKPGYCPRFLV
jgi:hypothetical protein